jgi:hypothetical protein
MGKLRAICFSLLGLCLLVAFNFSYFANCGLFIPGLGRAEKITFKNAHFHKETRKGYKSLSVFSMERFCEDKVAQEYSLRVRDLKDNWKTRNAAMSTLGTASYLDGASIESYESLALQSNPILQSNFEDLLKNILNYFQNKCPGSKVAYRENCGVPGFHIFSCNRLFSMPVASVHKDMQWNRLRYNEEETIDTNNTLSFTLALELPEGGGGLYTFEKTLGGLPAMIIPHPFIYAASKKQKIEYKTGYMVTHNGQTFHMIAPCKASEEKYRITLQGHGIYEKTKNTWWLYW